MTPSNAQSSQSGKASSQKKNESEDKPTVEEVVEAAVEKAPDPKENEATYSHDRLIRECTGAIGQDSATIAGALAGVSEDELTIKQAKAACRVWLKAEQG